MMIIKLIIICILFKYRNNVATLKRKIIFLGMTFNLNGSPANNLFTNMIDGRQSND